MTSVAIVTGICVENDAISAAVASQATSLAGLGDSVAVFAQHIDRRLPCPEHTVASSWELLRHPAFRGADVAIFHWGIHFDVFDAVAIMRGRVDAATGPQAVVHFHNCTPRHLVDESAREHIDRSVGQFQLVVGTDIPVWTFSEFNEQTLLDWGVRTEQIAFVPFAVEPPRPLRDRRRTGGVDLACVGRIVPAKAQHVAIDAVALLAPELRERVRLRIAGSELFSSAEYVRELADRVEQHELGSIVRFIGEPDDDALWRLYEASHVLVAPSLHEGLCVPVLEAYSAGCRAIGSDAGNLPYVVQPPDPIVPALDPAALAAAITRVADDVLNGRPRERANVEALLARYSAATARERLREELQRVMAGLAAR